jgi:hypothetical protein
LTSLELRDFTEQKNVKLIFKNCLFCLGAAAGAAGAAAGAK